LNQSKAIKLIDSKVLEQLYGFKGTHVALNLIDNCSSRGKDFYM